MFQIGFLSTNFAYVAILAAFYISYIGVYFNKPHETNFNSTSFDNVENNFGDAIFFQTKFEKKTNRTHKLIYNSYANYTNLISNNFCKIKILFIRKKNIVFSSILKSIFIRPPPSF